MATNDGESGLDDHEVLHEAAVRLLARREHSRAELTAKLAQRGFDEQQIESEIAHLAAAGLQDDARFADLFAEQRAARGDGPRKIEAALRERGIPAETIASALEPLREGWRQRAREALRKHFGETAVRDRKERARRARFLQNRGFPGGLAAEVIEESGSAESSADH